MTVMLDCALVCRPKYLRYLCQSNCHFYFQLFVLGFVTHLILTGWVSTEYLQFTTFFGEFIFAAKRRKFLFSKKYWSFLHFFFGRISSSRFFQMSTAQLIFYKNYIVRKLKFRSLSKNRSFPPERVDRTKREKRHLLIFLFKKWHFRNFSFPPVSRSSYAVKVQKYTRYLKLYNNDHYHFALSPVVRFLKYNIYVCTW